MPRSFPWNCIDCDVALCDQGCHQHDGPFDKRVAYGVGGGMHTIRKYTLWVNGIRCETEYPMLTVGEILALVALEGIRIKLLRTGAEFANPNYRIYLMDGDEFITPNVGHHQYDVDAFRRQLQAPSQGDKL